MEGEGMVPERGSNVQIHLMTYHDSRHVYGVVFMWLD